VAPSWNLRRIRREEPEATFCDGFYMSLAIGIFSGMTNKTKMTFSLETAPIIRRRATAAGKEMSAWVDEVVERADHQLRIRTDEATIQAAGLRGSEWEQRMAAIVAATRVNR